MADSTARFRGKLSGGTRRERLARRRRALGLTQEDLAAALEVERTTVVRWERGETEPLPWLRPRLAMALRVSADQLAELLHADGPPVPRQLPPAVTSYIWDSLGYIERHLGDVGEATACYERAVSVFAAAGMRSEVAELLIRLGGIWHQAGEPSRARQAWQEALGICEEEDLPHASHVRARLAAL